MSYLKNKIQSNFRLNHKGDYLAGQSFNLSNLKYYTVNQAWDFLKYFDLTPRSIRQGLLNHYKSRQN